MARVKDPRETETPWAWVSGGEGEWECGWMTVMVDRGEVEQWWAWAGRGAIEGDLHRKGRVEGPSYMLVGYMPVGSQATC